MKLTKHPLSVVVLLASLLAPVAASAAPKAAEPEVFDFDEDTISTDYLKPDNMALTGLRRGKRSSLISVRLDFVAEIVKSAEDI